VIDVDIEARLGSFELAVKFAADAPIVGNASLLRDEVACAHEARAFASR